MVVYERAFELLKQEGLQPKAAGLSLLRAETEKRPDDAKAWFEYAGAFDFLGREGEALPLYLKVRELGLERLPPGDCPRWYVQTGSTMRNLHMFSEAVELLSEGARLFPSYGAIKVFLALAHHSSGNAAEAYRIMLKQSERQEEDASLVEYGRAIRHYVDELKRSE